jgi:hypothetical protein
VRPLRAPHGRGLLRLGTGLTSVVGLVTVVGCALLAGRAAALGALLAVTLTLSFLLVGQLPLVQAARGRPRLAALLLLVLYVVRVLLLLAAFVAFYVSDEVDGRALGIGLMVCGAAWTAGVVWSALRWRPAVVEIDEAPAAADRH